MADARVLVGKIASAHGIKGDVKVICYAEDVELLFREDGVFKSETTRERVVLFPKSEPKPGLYICEIDGIDDRNAAERLNGTELYIDKSDLPELDDNAVYYSDVEGMEAVTPEGKPLGRVIAMRNFGAGELLEIQGKKDSYYIPFSAPYLVSFDKAAKRVVLNEPEVL